MTHQVAPDGYDWAGRARKWAAVYGKKPFLEAESGSLSQREGSLKRIGDINLGSLVTVLLSAQRFVLDDSLPQDLTALAGARLTVSPGICVRGYPVLVAGNLATERLETARKRVS
ncbi:hypothetical protein K431DRAFT_293920 [Polychaeton citri CBS 116435]|uniref:Uncharacterized protein n=1 Tax=Polychaeton citri CBS 116435 TaxID=1314669 RepID=A0A9P4UQR2_9PEZI|nr:hypothetical protein K431DRAFT_293920 [Polychaeton citri CBS 116435]